MAFENRYSGMDRLLHHIAFSTGKAQLALADLEDRLFRSQLDDVIVTKPVFITALPRAGTTLLLELCHHLDEFVSHCYADMPFVLIPMLWNKYAARFRRSTAPRERAHGDGMLVNIDSPEALEEMIWKAFWPKHYLKDQMLPWQDEVDEDCLVFLRNHFRKIIALRGTGNNIRYISKNNLNISRIDILVRDFSDAEIVIPFRHPLQHCASLLKQHRNFLTIHANDYFARKYMAAVGHFDFGENLKPINFNGWLGKYGTLNANTLSFWLAYWLAAYGNLLEKAGAQVHFLSYEAFCENPKRGLQRFADTIAVNRRDVFVEQATRIRVASPHPVQVEAIDKKLLAEAEELHRLLKDKSIV